MRVEFVHLFLSYYRRFFKSILSIGKIYSLRIFWCIFVYVYFVFSEEISLGNAWPKILTKTSNGLVYLEVLDLGQTVTADIYKDQLDRVDQELRR